MNVLARYAPLGARPYYYADDGLSHSESIRGVMAKTGLRKEWDHTGVRAYLARSPDGWRTCFAGIHAVAPGHELVATGTGCEHRACAPPPKRCPPLGDMLEQAVGAIVADGRRFAIALSGGLDSALLAAVLRRLDRDDIPIFTLASGLPGYCELERTSEAAAKLGLKELRVIQTNAEEIVAAYPEAIRAAETPLFNLHPVSRWLLAKALRREGYEVLLTGDGADQIFAGSDPRNYLPIVGALTRAAGLELRSPFFDEQLAACAPPPTGDKAALREASRKWLPSELVQIPKSATYAPPLDVSDFWNEAAIRDLAKQLDSEPPKKRDVAGTTLWTSLGLLAEHLI